MEEQNQNIEPIQADGSIEYQAPVAAPINDSPVTIPISAEISVNKVKLSSKKNVIIVCSVVLALLIVGVLIYFFNVNNSSKISTINSAAVSNEYKETVNGVYTLLVGKNEKDVISYSSNDKTGVPISKPKGSAYYTYPSRSSSITVNNKSLSTWSSTIQTINDDVVNYLTSHKYKKMQLNDHIYYSTSNSVCSIPDTSDRLSTYFGCADISSYAWNGDEISGVVPKNADAAITAINKLIGGMNTSKSVDIKSNFVNGKSPSYSPIGVAYKAATSKNVALSLAISEQNFIDSDQWTVLVDPILSNIDIFLTNSNFKKSADVNVGAGEISRYISDIGVCSLLNNSNPHKILLVCANISDYPSNVTGVDKFPSVLASAGISNKNVIFETPIIRDSVTPGYQNAYMDINPQDGMMGGYFVLLYKKVGGDWKYFKSAQQGLSCDTYNTTELRAAFSGNYCYDTATKNDSIVK